MVEFNFTTEIGDISRFVRALHRSGWACSGIDPFEGDFPTSVRVTLIHHRTGVTVTIPVLLETPPPE